MEQSLIQLDGKNKDLADILEKNKQEALRNLVTGTTPKDVVFQRPARGGLQVGYVPGWWFVGQANSLFNFLWNSEVLDQTVGEKQVWVKVQLTITVPGRTVIEKRSDGTTVETKLDPVTIVKVQFGGADVKRLKSTNEIIDIADDLKSAATDGLKKCFSLVGFASDIYGKREELEQTGPKKSQLEALYKVGETKGLTEDQVDEICTNKYGKAPEELEVVLLLGLMQELRTRGTNP